MSESSLLTALAVRKTFGPTTALSGASVAVDSGGVLAIMGPSGSGKSTLLHCLSGIMCPDDGTIHYRGEDVTEMPDRRRSELRRTEFGFVFQFGQLVPELTCRENVALPLRLGGVGKRALRPRVDGWLERLEVSDVADKRPGEVSGGQGQRVALARALVTEPSVVFADEPTGALDSLAGEKVMRLLVDSARGGGAAVVIVTHEPRVAAYADEEIVVRDGRTRQLEFAR